MGQELQRLQGQATQAARQAGCSGNPLAKVKCCVKDNVLGYVVKNTLMGLDRHMLGVDVHVGGMKLKPHLMEIDITKLALDNPPGFDSPHLLVAERVRINLDGASLLKSRGKKAVVDDVKFQGVTFTYEPHLLTSNIAELQKLNEKKETKRESKRDSTKDNSNQKETSKRELGNSTTSNKSDKVEKKMEFKLHEVLVSDIHARIYMHGFGPYISLADIEYKDFDTQFGGASAFVDIVRVLLVTMCKSVITTTTTNASALAALANGEEQTTPEAGRRGSQASMNSRSPSIASRTQRPVSVDAKLEEVSPPSSGCGFCCSH